MPRQKKILLKKTRTAQAVSAQSLSNNPNFFIYNIPILSAVSIRCPR